MVRVYRCDQSRPVSGEQLDPVAVDSRVHAVAVVLDLVQPLFARRRLRPTRRVRLRLDPLRGAATAWGADSDEDCGRGKLQGP